MLSTTTLAILASCFTAPTLAWQTEVHQQIGFMADLLINPTTKDMVASILEPKYKGELGLAAGWADEVRRWPTHSYSYGWHFISARDNPPNDCSLYYHRDCQAGGCVVQQIANQTDIIEECLLGSVDHSNVTCSEALKWVAHFVGDVAQPLHTSERAYGGNGIKVKFNGTDTNLHSAWDKDILYALVPLPKGASATQLDPYFSSLILRIQSDAFSTPVSTWTICDPSRSGTWCAELWARDSNAIVCDYAYGRYVNGSDLLTGPEKYADGALPIIEEQIAKAAWRLAGWLDGLAARVESFERELEMQRGLTVQEL